MRASPAAIERTAPVTSITPHSTTPSAASFAPVTASRHSMRDSSATNAGAVYSSATAIATVVRSMARK